MLNKDYYTNSVISLASFGNRSLKLCGRTRVENNVRTGSYIILKFSLFSAVTDNEFPLLFHSLERW